MPRLSSHFGRVSALALALTLVAVAAPRSVEAQEGKAFVAEAPVRIPAVTVAEVTSREFLQQVPVSGTLLPEEEVLVSPAISGYAITELTAQVGDRVEAGQVLARLDDRALRSQVAQAEAEMARAEAALRQSQSQVASAEATLTQATEALTRARALRASGAGTQAALEQAEAAQLTTEASLQSARDAVFASEAQIQQAQASFDLARISLESAQITAPVDGIVSERNGQIGTIASSGGDPIYRIIQDGLVEVEVKVIETELALISVDDPVELRIAGLLPVSGAVRQISPTVDPQSRLGSVRIALEPTEGLRPGLFAAGAITTERREGLGVPATAVISDTEGPYVLRVGDDGVLERRAVRPVLLWQDQLDISEGVEPGDVVLARAGAFFAEGDRVRPVREGETELAGSAEPGAEQLPEGETAQVTEARAVEDNQ